MKKGIKLFVCLLMVVVVTVPSIFATGLGTSSSIVKVGTIDDASVVYNVDIEWGNLVYNFVQKEVSGDASTYYVFEIAEENEDCISVTNYSNVVVNADIKFASNISSVSGIMNQDESSSYATLYSVLATEPEDFSTGTYYERTENNEFNLISAGTAFEADKYYKIDGAGSGPYPESGDIPACTEEEGIVECSGITYVLDLLGGKLSEIRPGATIGVVTVTLS